MSIQLHCRCGQAIRARDNQAGKRFRCPQCGGPIVVPVQAPPASTPRPSPPAQSGPVTAPTRRELVSDEQLESYQSVQAPSSGVGQLLLGIFIAWAFLFLLALGLAVVFPPAAAFTLFGAVSLVLLAAGIRILVARGHVLGDKKEIDLFFGLAKLISWDPTEGVLLLKNKNICFVDDNLFDGGGIRLIYPVLGEELACRAPLEMQTLSFHDDNVLTREYLPLSVHGTMKWRLTNIQRFYLLVSKEIHIANDREGHRVQSPSAANPAHQVAASLTATRKLEAAEQWLRYVAEEQTRSVVSRVDTGLLVAERVACDLPPEMREQVEGHVINPVPLIPSSPAEYRSATDGLAAAIHETVTPKVQEFGIDVHEVTLQEVRLPQHIHDAAVEACKSAYVPLVAQKHAIGRKMQLQAEADVIGAETVGAREVVGNAPAYALSDFLSTFLANNGALLEAKGRQRTAKAIGSQTS